MQLYCMNFKFCYEVFENSKEDICQYAFQNILGCCSNLYLLSGYKIKGKRSVIWQTVAVTDK